MTARGEPRHGNGYKTPLRYRCEQCPPFDPDKRLAEQHAARKRARRARRAK